MQSPGTGMWMGSEIEFGILDGWSLAKAASIQKVVVERHPGLPSDKSGVFLEGGGRAYVDQGKHNEYSTPEVDSPRELVIRELAGRRLMAEAAAGPGRVLLFANHDPVAQTSWGAHENYSCGREIGPAGLSPLFNHLATRIIYTGGGGRDPWRNSESPVLSARACHIRASYSEQGTLRKSLVFWKPEQHGSVLRLHVTSGESLLSQTASYLKYATTAMVIHALEQQLPLPGLQFAISPVRALRLINRDLSLSVRIPLADGRRLTALEIQRELLGALVLRLSDLPEWAGEALRVWAGALDDLENATPRALRRFDWILYAQLTKPENWRRSLRLLQETSPSGQDALLARRLIRQGRRVDLLAVGDLIYNHLHLAGPNPFVDRLESDGRFDPVLPGVLPEAVGTAMTTPPRGRAELRASFIRRRQEFPHATLSWGCLQDPARARTLPLPFTAEPGWDSKWVSGPVIPVRFIDAVHVRAEMAFRYGRYGETIALLKPRYDMQPDALSHCNLESLALAAARSGEISMLDELLARSSRIASSRLAHIALVLACGVHQGLVPPTGLLMSLVREGASLAEQAPEMDYHRTVYLQYAGWVLAADGQLEAAESTFRKLLLLHERDSRTRIPARTRCYLGEVLRRQGRSDEAHALCQSALATHAREQMFGDLAMHSQPLAARLHGNTPKGIDALELAREDALVTENDSALVRILCLRARCLRDGGDRETLLKLMGPASAFGNCRVATRILENWDEWISGPGEGPAADYWGV